MQTMLISTSFWWTRKSTKTQIFSIVNSHASTKIRRKTETPQSLKLKKVKDKDSPIVNFEQWTQRWSPVSGKH